MVLQYIDKQKVTNKGNKLNPNNFYLFKIVEKIKGFPFLLLLNEISTYVDWMPYMSYSLHHYFNKAYKIE
jgi:hypothetical protein